ncbi:hypothetical protein [Nocardia rhamnosiphila]|uniref:Uncharacterized protein n=1 Tax=Nocardia rhamnosiphila TaxID=426716 RepID=A0ABV2WYQ3_9NOCA
MAGSPSIAVGRLVAQAENVRVDLGKYGTENHPADHEEALLS